ncbi:MAG: hypothetical protein ABDH91_01180 [Bacteroidia bacterium]
MRINAQMRRLLYLPLSWALLHAEGTRQLMNGNCANHGYIQIWDNADALRNFATYNCPEYARLYIRVVEGERIYMGFHLNDGNDGNPTIVGDVWMRLRAPDGTVVMGPLRLHNGMGAGWINTCAQAMAGPLPLAPGGYQPLVYDVPAGISGNYYIEFAINNDPNIRQKRVFRWFDITVARWNGTAWVPRPGRLWSRKWDMTTRGGNNPFVGTLFTYSPDSVVTSFAFNGMRPYGFEVSCNSFGATNVGTPEQRRRSDYRQNIINVGGIPAMPEYPVFLNDPDPELFPTGIVASVDSFSVVPCTESSYCLYVALSKAGQVSIRLNFSGGRPPRTFLQTLNAGPNCIPWDGRDGAGNPVPNGTVVTAELDFFTGLTHLPLVDVEHHTSGFRVFLVRPTTRPNGTPLPDPRVYWDDILLTDPGNSLDGVQNLTGCQPTPGMGCHRWQNRGTNNANPEVINTWWYTNAEQHTFVLNVDPSRWRVFAHIVSCGGPNGVEVRLRFWHEIPIPSVSWNVTTNPPGLLGDPLPPQIDLSDPEWVVMTISYPVRQNHPNAVITLQVSASSSRYPYCRDEEVLSCTVLPVVWALPLKGRAFPEYNELEWATANEAGVHGFWIERRTAEGSFEPIRYVLAQGGPAHYTARDEAPPPANRWFYRLRIDEPGAAPRYSNTIELLATTAKPQLTYDPASQTLTVWLPEEGSVPLEVFSVAGQLVWQGVVHGGTYALPLASGVYVARLGDSPIRLFVP